MKIMFYTKLFTQILILNALFTLGLPATYFENIHLNNYLMQNYSSKFRPVLDFETKLDIRCTSSLIAVLEFNEIDGILKSVLSIKCWWIDEILHWNVLDFNNITMIRMHNGRVWCPPLAVVNSVDEMFLTGFSNGSETIRVLYDGNVTIITGAVVKTTCDVNIKQYPFDTHKCHIQIIAYGYDSSEITLYVTQQFVDEAVSESNNQWRISHVQNSEEIVTYQDINISSIKFIIELTRRPTFLILNLIMPLSVLQILNMMVFFLPSNSGERISFSITVLLTASSFWTIIVDKMPPTSRPIANLSLFNVSIVAINSMVTVTAIFISRIYHTDPDVKIPEQYKRVANFVRFFCPLRKHCVLRRPNSYTENITEHSAESGNEMQKSRDDDAVVTRPRRRNGSNGIETYDVDISRRKSVLPYDDTGEQRQSRFLNQDSETLTWEDVGKYLDKVVFTIFTLIFMASDITLLIALDPFYLF